MRIDRFITVYCINPFKKYFPSSKQFAIPILMYHGISDQLDDQLHPYFRTVTSPARFQEQMAILKESGYHVITFSKAVALLKEMSMMQLNGDFLGGTKSSAINGQYVVITFDDGLQDFYINAYPILEKFGYSATVFLTTQFLNGSFITGQNCLSSSEITELAQKGIEFGSHTVSHPLLVELPKEKISYELRESKKTIEQEVAQPISLFSYPFRFPEDNTPFINMLNSLLVDHDYSAGVTTIIGRAKPGDNLMFLKRLPINQSDDATLFIAKLNGSYDWLHAIQLIFKKLKAFLH
jgi:peptidoglycan/xylan/chitin deacetylase (PgdA/CDA1 family)